MRERKTLVAFELVSWRFRGKRAISNSWKIRMAPCRNLGKQFMPTRTSSQSLRMMALAHSVYIIVIHSKRIFRRGMGQNSFNFPTGLIFCTQGFSNMLITNTTIKTRTNHWVRLNSAALEQPEPVCWEVYFFAKICQILSQCWALEIYFYAKLLMRWFSAAIGGWTRKG